MKDIYKFFLKTSKETETASEAETERLYLEKIGRIYPEMTGDGFADITDMYVKNYAETVLKYICHICKNPESSAELLKSAVNTNKKTSELTEKLTLPFISIFLVELGLTPEELGISYIAFFNAHEEQKWIFQQLDQHIRDMPLGTSNQELAQECAKKQKELLDALTSERNNLPVVCQFFEFQFHHYMAMAVVNYLIFDSIRNDNSPAFHSLFRAIREGFNLDDSIFANAGRSIREICNIYRNGDYEKAVTIIERMTNNLQTLAKGPQPTFKNHERIKSRPMKLGFSYKVS